MIKYRLAIRHIHNLSFASILVLSIQCSFSSNLYVVMYISSYLLFMICFMLHFAYHFGSREHFLCSQNRGLSKVLMNPPLKTKKVVIMSSFPMMPCFNTLCVCPCCLDFLLHHIHHSLIPSRFCSLQGIIYTRKMNKLTSLLFYFILS